MKTPCPRHAFTALASAAACCISIFLLVSAASAQSTETVLYSFQGTTDGDAPGGLIAGPDGSFYGVAASGGANGLGVVYQLTPPAEAGEPWIESVLYSFQGGSDGYQPYSGLARDSAGNLYGVTYNGGGIDDYGVVYEVSPSSGGWTEKVIYAFQGPTVGDGFAPNGTLAIGPSGQLFGTTGYGGAGDYGTVYQLTPSHSGAWTEKVLYSFTGGADGGEPFAGPIRASNGVLYGTTAVGGTSSLGTAYSLTESAGSWAESVIHSFAGGERDGSGPESPLYLDASGNLFGATPTGIGKTCSGGLTGCGMFFELSPNPSGGWTETVLYAFKGGDDGSQPTGAIISNGHGTFWGTTLSGGSGYCDDTVGYGCGTVYQLRNLGGRGTETTLYAFQDGDDGAYPQAGVVLKGGKLYGTANQGGSTQSGVIFEIP